MKSKQYAESHYVISWMEENTTVWNILHVKENLKYLFNCHPEKKKKEKVEQKYLYTKQWEIML